MSTFIFVQLVYLVASTYLLGYRVVSAVIFKSDVVANLFMGYITNYIPR